MLFRSQNYPELRSDRFIGGINNYPCKYYPYGTFPKFAIEYLVVFNNRSLFPKV